jgi:methionine aminotransferase
VLKNLVNHYVNNGFNQYAPMAGVAKLRDQLAKKIHHLYQLDIDIEKEITITAGATQAIYTAISAFVNKGDEVIIVEPAYDSYGPSVEVNGGKVIPYRLMAPGYSIDWNKMRDLISDRTKMILINSPHNPTGKIFSADDIQQLETLTKDSNIIVLSDEVYEHLSYDGNTHESVLKYPNLYQRSLAIFSFGKTFHSTGWKLGYCVGPEHLMEEFKKVHQFNVFCVNHPIQCAIADYMEEPQVYLGLNDFFEKKRDLFLDVIANSKFVPITCQGTYFQMVNYAAISEEKDMSFAKRLITDHGVASIPVSAFYSNPPDDHVIRFCFAKTDEVLIEAGSKLCLI